MIDFASLFFTSFDWTFIFIRTTKIRYIMQNSLQLGAHLLLTLKSFTKLFWPWKCFILLGHCKNYFYLFRLCLKYRISQSDLCEIRLLCKWVRRGKFQRKSKLNELVSNRFFIISWIFYILSRAQNISKYF